MEIYLTRHGETLWNKEGRVQGFLDSPLSEKGILHAEKLRDRLRGEKLDACYSSNQGRAVHTGQIVMEYQKGALIQTDKLKELGVGAWQGMYYEDIKRTYADEFNTYVTRADLYKPTNGGEEYQALEYRVGQFLEGLAPSSYKKVLIVTHGVTYLMILNLMEKRHLRDLCTRSVPEGGALSKILYKGGDFHILYEDDSRHLRGIL